MSEIILGLHTNYRQAENQENKKFGGEKTKQDAIGGVKDGGIASEPTEGQVVIVRIERVDHS